MKSQAVLINALVFLALLVVGGMIGYLSLPAFQGRFFVSGMLVAIFGTGAGFLILKVLHR